MSTTPIPSADRSDGGSFDHPHLARQSAFPKAHVDERVIGEKCRPARALAHRDASRTSPEPASTMTMLPPVSSVTNTCADGGGGGGVELGAGEEDEDEPGWPQAASDRAASTAGNTDRRAMAPPYVRGGTKKTRQQESWGRRYFRTAPPGSSVGGKPLLI
jgi:hypothetical protein